MLPICCNLHDLSSEVGSVAETLKTTKTHRHAHEALLILPSAPLLEIEKGLEARTPLCVQKKFGR